MSQIDKTQWALANHDVRMTPNAHYHALLKEMQRAYSTHPELTAFAPFPKALARQPLQPSLRQSCTLLKRDRQLTSKTYPNLQNAVLLASDHMLWRETYKGCNGTQFMDRWGCFAVVGEGGPFASDKLRLFVIYMPPSLFYPWHRHPAEEMYLVIAGQAVFKKEGCKDRILSEGDTVFHASDQAHAIETREAPLLCLVAWRTHLNIPPVLVPDPTKKEAAPEDATSVVSD